MSGLSEKVRVKKGIVFNEVAGEAVLLNKETGKYFTLDEVGARMWKLITQFGDLQPVYQALLEEYDVDPQRLEEDLLALTDKLVANALLEIVAP
jgi:hypothetical protein